MSNKKIRRQAIPHRGGRIPPVTPQLDKSPLRFSFCYLDSNNERFGPQHCADGYLSTFLERLRDLSRLTVTEFRSNKSKAIRAHRIDFGNTTEPQGFTCLNEQLRAEEAWQFEVTRSAHGRVHGILQDNTFCIIWIDPRHRLYE